jgi:uncharacterized protein with LGFP repeats
VIRTLVRLVTVAAVAATTLLVPASVEAPGSAAEAADMRLFDAGNIISDAVFFDALSMGSGAVQRFLDAKGASCVAAEMPCLKDYRQDTADQAVDKMCAGYRGARAETAATIITKVAASCGISPRVLLVLLQKEQSLVTRRTPTVYAYTHATGFACPDTAPCNPAFSGFVSQVYFAARQFQRYKIESSRYGYKAGRVNTIQWHPNAACGSSQVFLANQATAGLYNYTPYRPTDAALHSGPAGVPQTDPAAACAAYGNRNFWTYFTDWFGSTQSTGAGEILIAYNALGGTRSWLGAVTSGYICGLVRGGCFQHFQSGSIYWSPATGAHALRGSIAGTWGAAGWENGWLGYPTSDELCGLPRGGCAQNFQGAALYFSPKTGVAPVEAPMYAGYAASGFERGPLGYPLRRQVCGLVRGGCAQAFESGTVYLSPASGAHTVRGALFGVWGSRGYERGSLGYPTGEESCGAGAQGCVQSFQGATLTWSPATGGQNLGRWVGPRWTAMGGPRSPVGQPVGPEICGLARGGCFQAFQRATLYASPVGGTRAVGGAIYGVWASRGFETGALGYPIGDEQCAAGVCVQAFEKATMSWSPATGPQYLRGAIGARWTQLGGPMAAVGAPLGPEICGLAKGGCFQGFSKGSIYYSPATGAHPVDGAIRDAWAAAGWESGRFGYPVEGPREVPGGVAQRFQGGTLTLTAASGVVAPS